MARQTVRLVIIGNEVLSGKVVDANSPWLLGRLRQIGAVCTGVRVIPDTMGEVAQTVSTEADSADWVITTGGVGPTHDDITMAGIARGFDVAVIEDPSLLAILASHMGFRASPQLPSGLHQPHNQVSSDGGVPTT